MERTLALETTRKVGQEVLLKGWVNRRRDHGRIIFVDLRDRSGLVQLIISEELLAKNDGLDLHSEYVIAVTGKAVARSEATINPNLATGKVEVQVRELTILAKAESLPFDMGGEELNLELPTLLDYRSLTLRHGKVKPIFKVQEVVIDAFREALKKLDFTEFQAPVLIPEGAEGGAEVFKVPYFGREVYLSQSPQLYKQILVGVYERVFSVNKTLRAEPSVTTRHLTEATTLDAEFGFIESWLEVKAMAEYTIKYMLSRVERECGDVLKMFGATVPKVSEEIPALKLREAQEVIYKRTSRDHRQEPDLDPEDEREICRWSLAEKGSDLVFVSHYPAEKRPFYTFLDPENPEFTLSMDLIGRGTEWMTGGQRINDYDFLIQRAREKGADTNKLELYLQAFRYGLPPEGGFSFGSERITMHILGLKNVREASLFPRDMERVDFRLSKIQG